MAISEDQGISCEMKNLLKFLSILVLNIFYLIGLWLKHAHVICPHYGCIKYITLGFTQ